MKATNDELGTLPIWPRGVAAPLLVLSVASFAGLPPIVLAQSDRSVVWDQIDETVELREDSSFHVTERDRSISSADRSVADIREIPLARIDAIDNVRAGEVTGDTVQPYRYVSPGDFSADVPNTYTSREVGPTLRIEWSFPRTTSQSRTFQIDYDALGALRVYNDAERPYQQISWIGVGEEITKNAPVNNAILRFVLPRPVDPGRTFIQGPGSQRPEDHTDGREDVDLDGEQPGPGGLAGGGSAVRAAGAGDGALVAGGERSPGAAAGRARGNGWPAQPPLPGTGAAHRHRWRGWLRWPSGGHVVAIPKLDRSPISFPDPPDNLPPGLIGALIDEQVDQRDIVATLVDLGQRGVLRIDRSRGRRHLWSRRRLHADRAPGRTKGSAVRARTPGGALRFESQIGRASIAFRSQGPLRGRATPDSAPSLRRTGGARLLHDCHQTALAAAGSRSGCSR